MFRKIMICNIALYLALMMTACQPTPEKNIVASKNALQIEYDKDEAAQSRKALIEQLEAANYHINMEIQANDKVKVVVDAEIMQMNYDTIPVVRVSPENITTEQLNELIDIAAKDNPVYYRESDGWNYWSKEEIEEMCMYLEATLNNGKLIDYLSGDAKATQSSIRKGYDAALSRSEERVYVLSSMEATQYPSGKGYGLKSYLGRDRAADFYLSQANNKAHTRLSFRNINYYEWIKYSEQYTEENARGIDLSYEKCKEIAEEIAVRLDGEDTNLEIYKAEILYMGNIYLQLEKEECWPQYRFTFGRQYDDLVITQIMAITNSNEPDFYSDVKPEAFSVMVGKEGITDFEWTRYTKFQDIVSPDAPLLSFETILEKFENQLRYQFVWTPSLDNGNLSEDSTAVVYINEVCLNVMLIQEQNNLGYYVMVPVWDFIGDEDYDVEQVFAAGPSFDGLKNISIVTINAIDGSIIDRNKGY